MPQDLFSLFDKYDPKQIKELIDTMGTEKFTKQFGKTGELFLTQLNEKLNTI